jgi:hypothetical protein
MLGIELYGEDANEGGLVGATNAEKGGDLLALEATDSLEDPGLFTSACFCLTSVSMPALTRRSS